ncbi:MAG: glycosyltransferase family 2 protein [Oscillospiraceae bacterium]|nr:glycosyltransferase family 2 protein [Oscillospiraceae bacterium]
MSIIYIVVPCYNEEQVLPETSSVLKKKLRTLIADNKISDKSRIVFVNDGSGDSTWSLIEQLASEDNIFQGIKLSRNKGHQNALLAGLMTVKDHCDAAISMDADLQDDINAIDEMIEKFEGGCDIVYGVRSERKTDTFFKKSTAQAYYKLLALMGVDIVYNHADYRLMSRRALGDLEQFREVNLFLRGIVPMIGYKTDTVYYERHERFAGESKYPLKKMLAFAMEGITSFSVKPIRFITSAGFILFVLSILMLIYFLVRHFTGHTVAGWTSLAFSVWAIGGLQLLAIGIVGEYIGKIYMETKARPKYIIEKYLHNDDK